VFAVTAVVKFPSIARRYGHATIQAARTEFFAQGIPDRTRAGRLKPAFTGLLEPERWVQQ
jgi:hypothetical protein